MHINATWLQSNEQTVTKCDASFFPLQKKNTDTEALKQSIAMIFIFTKSRFY